MQPYLFILIGLGIIIVCLLKKTKNDNLKQKGIRAEGIIFNLDQQPNNRLFSVASTDNIKDKVTVRFVTDKQEWITEDISQDFASFFTGQYKAGDKIIVYYNANNPRDFYVETKQNEKLTRIFLLIVGMIFLSIGLYQMIL